MNEILRLTYDESERQGWEIRYCLSLPTPADREATDPGWSQVETSEIVDGGIRFLGSAVEMAKEWATGSGYKVGPPKIASYDNLVEIRLRRP